MYIHTSGLTFATHAEVRHHCPASLPVTLTAEILESVGYTELIPEAPAVQQTQAAGPVYPQPTPSSGTIGVTIYD